MLTDLRENKEGIKPSKKFNIFYFLLRYKMEILYIIITLILGNIIFNPINTANVLSNWVNNFIGTFLHNIKI